MARSKQLTAKELNLLFSYFNEIGIIAQLAVNQFEKHLPAGLTQSQFAVLNWFVRVDREATPGRLATAFQVTGGAMTNTLKKLAEKDLILIEPDPSSGRRKRITLTAAGLKMRERAIASAAPYFATLAEQFSPASLGEQLPQLQALRRYLDQQRYADGDGPPGKQSGTGSP